MTKPLKKRIEIETAYSNSQAVEYFRYAKPKWVLMIQVDSVARLEDYIFDWIEYDYRIKPVPREWWINLYDNGNNIIYEDKEEAEDYSSSNVYIGCIDTVHVREVL